MAVVSGWRQPRGGLWLSAAFCALALGLVWVAVGKAGAGAAQVPRIGLQRHEWRPLVAIGMDVSWNQYMHQTQGAVTLTHILTGLAKSVAFGALIALAGCRAGMQCGRSSEAVGKATTQAVVTAIVWLIVADAAFNIVYQRLGI